MINFYSIWKLLNCSKEDEKMKKMLLKIAGIAASLALTVTAMSVNVACIFIIHQPKLPKGAEKLRKF